MISRHTLDNGLRIVHYEDTTTQMVAVNVLYDVGARDEDPEHTGYAHLLEHLMFEGSIHIPDYDTHVQMAGGENNAWTNNDLTNYYITLPRTNVETAFWLESDRMMGLALTEQSVEVQKDVVIEEFKQQHLNRPYGDVQHLIRSMAYKQHPYQWPTIGVCPEHIEQATLEDVIDFYHRFYVPSNAILSIVGNISAEETFRLAEKWFGPIPSRDITPRTLPQEEPQTSIRRQSVYRNVPANLLAMAFHMPCRKNHDYHTCDLITDLLSAGNSSRLVQHLIRRDHLFTSIDAYIQGSMDAGLLFVIGRVAENTTLEEAEAGIWKELDELKSVEVAHEELSKVRNRSESERTFNNMNYLNRAINMAQMELIGQDRELHEELQRYCSVTPEDILHASNEIFRKENCSVLYYEAEN